MNHLSQMPVARDIRMIIYGSLILAVIVTFISAILLTIRNSSPLDRMGPGKWDYNQSWASTITGMGLILGSVLSAQVLPAAPIHLPKQSYGALGVLFAALIVLAPLLYNMVRFPVQVHPDPKQPDKTEIQYQGFVGVFLVASTLTVWGATGQLITIGLLFDEIRRMGVLPPGAVLTLQTTLGCVSLFLLLFSGFSIYGAAIQQRSESADRKARLLEALGKSASTSSDEKNHQIHPTLPDWPLL
jgi:hypothetical protein